MARPLPGDDDAPIRTARFDELTTRELHDIVRLRCDVFVVEQTCPYPELDGRDTEPHTVHVWVPTADGSIAAYLRVLREPDGSARIGRVVTAADHRRAGLARRLVEHVAAVTAGPIVLDAQSYLADWYESLGYEVCGEEYVEDGIPHVPMRRA